MRLATLTCSLLLLAATTPALAQSSPAPQAAPCDARAATLGGVGRATVVSFTGPIFGDRVCATVANFALGLFTATLADAPSATALADATVGRGDTATLAIQGAGDLNVVPSSVTLGTTVATAPVGPFVVAPGGTFPSFGGDTSSAPRVVVAFAGQRLLLIGTTPVALPDLARVLREQPDLFGADSIERAVVIASGPNAAVALHTDAGLFGSTTLAGGRVLELSKR